MTAGEDALVCEGASGAGCEIGAKAPGDGAWGLRRWLWYWEREADGGMV